MRLHRSCPFLLVLAACTPMRMAVPGPLATAPEWRVRSHGWRSDRLTFGPYEAHQIRHDTRQRGGILDALTGKRERQQRYDFRLRDTTAASDLWMVSCDHRDVERGISVVGVQIELDARTGLDCTLHPPGDSTAAWKLDLGSRGDRLPTGGLRRGLDSAAYEVRGQTASGQGCCGVAGFLIRRDGIPVVAVDRADGGWVRMGSAARPEEQALLAAVAGALLIPEDLLKRAP